MTPLEGASNHGDAGKGGQVFGGTFLVFPLAIRGLLCWINPTTIHHGQFWWAGGRPEGTLSPAPISAPPHVLAPRQWDLVCSSRGLKQLAQSLYMAGVLVGGIIFGGLSDR